jgi:large subunit ribosomal protein L25
MEMIELTARVRSQTGKKGARQCRAKGLVPGILYGSGDVSAAIAVEPRNLDRALHTHAGSNVIIKLAVEERGGEPVTVVVKELQVDPVKGTMRHVDFCRISLDKKIHASVPFKIVGEAPGVKKGGVLEHALWELDIESLPLNIPDYIEVDVNDLNIGDSLLVSSLKVPEGIKVLNEPDVAVVSIIAPRIEAAVEAPAAPVEGAEPEVVGAKTEKEGEEAAGKEEKPAAEEKKTGEKRKAKE